MNQCNLLRRKLHHRSQQIFFKILKCDKMLKLQLHLQAIIVPDDDALVVICYGTDDGCKSVNG